MSDQELLVAAVALLYLSECWAWIRRGSILFRCGFSRRFCVVHPSYTLGNARGGWVFLNPLPPLGTGFACHPWPLSLTKDLACSYVAHAVNFRERRAQVLHAVRWDDVRDVSRSGSEVIVNGSPLADLGDEARAARFARLLSELAARPLRDRDAAIDAALRAATDVRSVRRAADSFRASTFLLRLLCCVLFALLLVALPLSVLLGRFADLAPRLLAAAAACWPAVLWMFWLAHAHLLPGRRGARWRSLAVMVLTPTAAIRACDAVARDLLSPFDPLAVALVLCDRPAVEPFARAVLLDLLYPLLPICPSANPEMLEAEGEFRKRELLHLRDLVRRAGMDPDALTAPPPRAHPSHLSFCPRCHTEYVVAEGRCTDCGGRPLRAFPTHDVPAADRPRPSTAT